MVVNWRRGIKDVCHGGPKDRWRMDGGLVEDRQIVRGWMNVGWITGQMMYRRWMEDGWRVTRGLVEHRQDGRNIDG